ncbi:unnamed protein product [Lupinus luteus]|uniref:K Homology domain-containing protein n=1 Tax=Lupinus luteus TaxID=3873 RepID=A0AAV1W8R8_LUPLU
MASSKRPNSASNGKRKGRGKRHKSIGSVIGKGGTIVTQIRNQTGVKLIIEEPVPQCDERVITILGDNEEIEEDDEQGNEVSNNEDGRDSKEKDDEVKEESDNNEDKDSVPVEGSKSEKESSSILKALSLVFERVVDGTEEAAEGDKESNSVSRLLVLSSQVGCLLGKGGSIIKQMLADSGAQIRILPKDKLPICALASDELVQITGDVEVIRKAFQSVSKQLLENRPRDHESLSVNSAGRPSHSFGPVPPHNRSFASGSRDISSALIPKFHEGAIPSRMRPSQEMLTFRLLCPTERVGNIIGKAGAIVKALQQETACEIKHPDDRISPVQEAVFRVQGRISRDIPDAKEHSILARVLVSSNQIGCLLGKAGSIISEMRKLSGAHVRILGKDQVPKCATEDEEVIQISGEFEAVHDALFQVTTRLRHDFFRDAFPSVHYPSNSAFLDRYPPLPYLGRRGLSPPGLFSNMGPPPPLGAFPLDDRPPFMNNIHRPGVPPHISERRPWGPQGLFEDGGPMGLPDFAGAPPRRIPAFAGCVLHF